MGISIDLSRAESYLEKDELRKAREKAGMICRALYEKEDKDKVLGWRTKEASVLQLAEIKAKAEEIVALGKCFSLKDLAVSGRDVIAAGIAPGPEVGRVLNELLGQVLNGLVPNNREALLSLITDEQPNQSN